MRAVQEAVRESTNKVGVAVSDQSLRSVYAAGAEHVRTGRLGGFVSSVRVVVRLAVGECVETPAASPVAPSSLAAGLGACRAGPGEVSDFEGVNPRSLTEYVLANAARRAKQPARAVNEFWNTTSED